VLREAAGGAPELILMGSGSEVHLLVAAAASLESAGIAVRVVSFPSWKLFAAAPRAYREAVLPVAVSARVAVEAGTSLGWERWVGAGGAIHGIDHFGASAPAAALADKFGFTVERVIALAREVLGGKVSS
jgi:transketolase